ncbi:MAG: CPBP family intramembrane metalloprotease [Anaerolineae bacterium]|nr:CPBP family intramembrane metalloprotease [Anaerolineae bacterium]
MKQYPVVWFYILAFGISWLGWVPVALGSHGVVPFNNPYFQFLLLLPVIGPALAAVIVTQATQGRTGVRGLFGALVRWRVGLVWYIVAVLGPLAILMAARAITGLLGLSPTGPAVQGDPLPLAISAFITSLFSNPWEEIGWRGFALPRLQRRHTALLATLLVGTLWGLWHLPLFFWVGQPMSGYPFLPWFIGTVAVTFIYTWLYNSTQGSLLPVTLFHIALNTFVVVSGVSVVALAIAYCLIAIALTVALGGRHLSRRERVC